MTDYTRASTRPDLRPLVVIQESNIASRQAIGLDLRGNRYTVDISVASGGVLHFPVVGSRWYIAKIGDRWVLSSRFGQQNPQLSPSLTPAAGDTYIGGEGTTYVVGGFAVVGNDPELGMVKICTTAAPPSLWMITDGSAISRTTYSALFALIGTTYGVGNGTTTFNIPNIKGRTVVGLDAAQTEFDVLGETGGAKTHTLVTGELPSHNHTQDSHTHTFTGDASGAGGDHKHAQGAEGVASGSAASRIGVHINGDQSGGGGILSIATFGSGDHTHTTSGTNASTTATNQTTGSGTAHNNLQPYITLNYMIKVLPSYPPLPPPVGPSLTETAFHAVGTVPTDEGHTARVSGDTFKRFIVRDNGVIEWGPGDNVTDVNLYRGTGLPGVGVLTTDSEIWSWAPAGGFFGAERGAFLTQLTGDTVPRLNIKVGGGIEWGSGSATRDTNLYRSASNVLKTDDMFIAGGGLTVGSVEVDPSSPASGHLLRHNGTKFVSVAEESNAQYPNTVFVQAVVNSTTTSGTYVDVPNISVSFTKNKSGTKVHFSASWSWYNNNAGASYYWAVLINSVDYPILQMISTNLANTRLPGSGENIVSGLSAGTYTVKLRYHSSAGATLSMDVSDFANLTVTEVK